jgi:tRNA threonylcarbamoyladenosine biosynthesis protein TsaE
MREYLIEDERATYKFARDLCLNLKEGDILALIGDLGTGKTTLTQYIGKGLGITERITSPTFTMVNEYHSGRIPLFHFDFYRLESPEDAFEIGIEEYFWKGGICVIEWADKLAEILPESSKYIFMDYGKEKGQRIYRCTF